MTPTNTAPASARPAASAEFLRSLEEMMELPPATLSGDDALAGTAEWNSLAVLEFMALADSQFGVTPGVERIGACVTFNDLYALLAS